MKICPNCNSKNFDTDKECGKCGYPLQTTSFETVLTVPLQNANQESKPLFYVRRGASGLQTVAKAFLIIGCVSFAISLATAIIFWITFIGAGDKVFSYIWLGIAISNLANLIIAICITNNYSYKIANGLKVGTPFKIATLLLVSIVAGILMLCDNDK